MKNSIKQIKRTMLTIERGLSYPTNYPAALRFVRDGKIHWKPHNARIAAGIIMREGRVIQSAVALMPGIVKGYIKRVSGLWIVYINPFQVYLQHAIDGRQEVIARGVL